MSKLSLTEIIEVVSQRSGSGMSWICFPLLSRPQVIANDTSGCQGFMACSRAFLCLQPGPQTHFQQSSLLWFPLNRILWLQCKNMLAASTRHLSGAPPQVCWPSLMHISCIYSKALPSEVCNSAHRGVTLTPVYPNFLKEVLHPPGDIFPCALQLMNDLALKSRQDDTEWGEALEDGAQLWMKRLWV
jgi:hypothetical protein